MSKHEKCLWYYGMIYINRRNNLEITFMKYLCEFRALTVHCYESYTSLFPKDMIQDIYIYIASASEYTK